MSENHTDCSRFEAVLLAGAPEAEIENWHAHLETCDNCRRQWAIHQMLVATFLDEAVPELSPAFEAGLQRKISTALEIKPLRGWRVAALAGYALVAALVLGWVFKKFPLPSISIDPASPWTLALALLAVPVTMWLTIWATRWLPSKRSTGSTQLSLL